MTITGSASLDAILILVAGAVAVLLMTAPLVAAPGKAAYVAGIFALGALVVGLAAPGGATLSIVGLAAVSIVALLLVPALELQAATQRIESAALVLLGTAGAMALANPADLLQAVVGLETLALSAVTLVALSEGERSLEAAFKYFVLGAVSLAGLLYGVGLIYLGTGTFAFPALSQVTGSHLVLAGSVLVASGFAFEMAVFPFHWGGLDAYTAAAPGIAGYVMSASKLAAAFALGRLVTAAGAPVGQVLVWIGCLTIIWGTFGALGQRTSLRRMLGYSAVTHAGFIVLAAGCGPAGPATAGFYAAVYASMAMLVFAALAGFGTGAIPFEQLGTEQLSPVRAGALALGLFSLSGIPPTTGFWAKLAVLVVAWQAAGPLPALIAAAGGVFSVLYYLRPVPDLFATLRRAAPVGLRQPASIAAIAVAASVVVVLGLFPGLAWVLAGT